jgi:FkbH-like protein
MVLTRKISLLFQKPYKVLVLDCDHTLWKGVCSEDGPTGVVIDEPYLALQQFVRQQIAAGMLVCICSKNDLADVKPVFREHPGMVLREEDVTSWRVNWEPKSSNLRMLAAELQLSIESFIFIDDSPVECAEVSSHCPEVLTLCLPRDVSAIPRFLQHLWVFDREAISVEDTRRTRLYRENYLRQRAAAQAISFQEFLGSLNLQVSIQQAGPEQFQRISQLSQRTNQFNSSGMPYSESELQQATSERLEILSVEVRDCFGDYGLVGAVVCRKNVSLSVEAFYLSCRVLGRGVEHRIIAQLGSLAQAAGLNSIRIFCRESLSNQPFCRFVHSLGGMIERSMRQEISIFLKTEDALKVTFTSPETMALTQERPAPQANAAPPHNNHHTSSMKVALSKLPHTLININELQAFADYFASANRKAPTKAGFAAPLNELEQQIALTWTSVLGTERIGRDENFFDAGGNSLRFMQLAARLSEKFGRNFEITQLFQFPTISSFAAYLGRNAPEQPTSESYERGLRTKTSLQQLKMRMAAGRR